MTRMIIRELRLERASDLKATPSDLTMNDR
jgi:hypothetical protein